MIVSLNFFGEDFVCEIDYRVTSYGSPAHMGSLSYPGDPGDPPEFEIESIVLYRDTPTWRPVSLSELFPPRFEATGALFDCLANLDAINDAICQEIDAYGPPEPDYDDRDF